MGFYDNAFSAAGLPPPQPQFGNNSGGFLGAALDTADATTKANAVKSRVGAFANPGSNPYSDAAAGVKDASALPNAMNQVTGAANASRGSTGAPLAEPGYYEDWYKKYGQDLMGTPSASEDLYSKGAAGSNPFYDNAQDVTIKAINDASGARGDFNSSYTLHNIGTAVADLRGQQAHELGQLAGQADQSRFGRYDRSSGYADTAQGRMEGRANMGFDAANRVANERAGLVNGFYGEGGREYTAANMASIEAALKKSGLSAEQTKQFMDMLLSTAGTVTKAMKP